MGLFDAFGVGGGSVSIQLQSPTVQAGGMVAGVATFAGGRRAQDITALKARLTCSVRTQRKGPNGIEDHTETQTLVPEFAISPRFTVQAGQQAQFPFQMQLPPTAPPTMQGQVTYNVNVSADIDGEVDPGANATLTVVGGMGAGMGMPAMMNPMGGAPMMNPMMGKGGGGLSPGEHCQAQWTDGAFYGATVLQANGAMFQVQWDDGTPPSWLRADQVTPDAGNKAYGAPAQGFAKQPAYEEPYAKKGAYGAKGGGGGLNPGDHCQAQWTDGAYYGATVTQFNGHMYQVQWDDGSPPLWVRPDQVSPG